MMDATLHNAIRTAIKQGDLQSVIDLIGDDDTSLRMMTPFGTWLQVAATLKEGDICNWLVSRGIDVNARGGIADDTALNCAASEGHTDIVKYLIGVGACMDTSEPERNPLFAAVHCRSEAMARLLLDSGIDWRVQYLINGKTRDALQYAREWGCPEIVRLLEGRET